MPKVIPYALRHSSIVHGLRKGLPIQQVAELQNTSVKMIERHYAKYIATALEDLARAAVVSLVPRSDGNVVPMGKRASRYHPAVSIEFIRLMASHPETDIKLIDFLLIP